MTKLHVLHEFEKQDGVAVCASVLLVLNSLMLVLFDHSDIEKMHGWK